MMLSCLGRRCQKPSPCRWKKGKREAARSGERQDTFQVPAEQLYKVIRDLDEVRGDLAGVEEVQDA